MIYGGDGLARLPADERGRGKAVFLPFVLERERVEASLIEEKSGFARGRAEKIVQTSPDRVQARCPYFTRCGGCQYQHTTYEHQLEIKAAILRENLRRITKLDLPYDLQVHSREPWGYRNRTRMRVQSEREFALGYYRFGSHELLPVEECPISSPAINRAIGAVWELGRKQEIHSGVREIEFFASADDSELLIDVYVNHGDRAGREKQVRRFARNDEDTSPFLRAAEQLRATVPGATGVVVFPAQTFPGGRKSEESPLATAGTTHLQYKTRQTAYRVSAGSFFQVNRFLTDELVATVTQGKSGGTALDLYAGVGLFSAVLSREFERVIAVESSPQSCSDLAYNAPGNVKAVRATVEEYVRKSPVRADLVIVDPPRGGLGEKVSRAIAESGAPALTYVSCDPATLARDLVVLLGAGYRVEQAHLVDLFPQTFHLETVLHLTR